MSFVTIATIEQDLEEECYLRLTSNGRSLNPSDHGLLDELCYAITQSFHERGFAFRQYNEQLLKELSVNSERVCGEHGILAISLVDFEQMKIEIRTNLSNGGDLIVDCQLIKESLKEKEMAEKQKERVPQSVVASVLKSANDLVNKAHACNGELSHARGQCSTWESNFKTTIQELREHGEYLNEVLPQNGEDVAVDWREKFNKDVENLIGQKIESVSAR